MPQCPPEPSPFIFPKAGATAYDLPLPSGSQELASHPWLRHTPRSFVPLRVLFSLVPSKVLSPRPPICRGFQSLQSLTRTTAPLRAKGPNGLSLGVWEL